MLSDAFRVGLAAANPYTMIKERIHVERVPKNGSFWFSVTLREDPVHTLVNTTLNQTAVANFSCIDPQDNITHRARFVIPPHGRICVLGGGKATIPIAAAAEDIFSDLLSLNCSPDLDGGRYSHLEAAEVSSTVGSMSRVCGAMVYKDDASVEGSLQNTANRELTRGSARPIIALYPGTHPIPSESCVVATRAQLQLIHDAVDATRTDLELSRKISGPGVSCSEKGVHVETSTHQDQGKCNSEAMIQGVEVDILFLCLLSGGGSALLTAPSHALDRAISSINSTHASLTSLGCMQRLGKALLASGAPIQDINVVRGRVDAIKAGGLARACVSEALRAGLRVAVHTFALSDVLSDDLRVIASGPSIYTPLPSRGANHTSVDSDRENDEEITLIPLHPTSNKIDDAQVENQANAIEDVLSVCHRWNIPALLRTQGPEGELCWRAVESALQEASTDGACTSSRCIAADATGGQAVTPSDEHDGSVSDTRESPGKDRCLYVSNSACIIGSNILSVRAAAQCLHTHGAELVNNATLRMPNVDGVVDEHYKAHGGGKMQHSLAVPVEGEAHAYAAEVFQDALRCVGAWMEGGYETGREQDATHGESLVSAKHGGNQVYACVRGGELTVSLASNEDFTRLFPAPCLTDDFFHTLAEVEIGSLGDNKAAEDSIRKLSDFLLSAYEASSSQCTAITQSADQECQTTSSVSSPNGGRCQEASLAWAAACLRYMHASLTANALEILRRVRDIRNISTEDTSHVAREKTPNIVQTSDITRETSIAATLLAVWRRVVLRDYCLSALFAGTDGSDGPNDAAGGHITTDGLSRLCCQVLAAADQGAVTASDGDGEHVGLVLARVLGCLDALWRWAIAALQQHSSYHWLEAAQRLCRGGELSDCTGLAGDGVRHIFTGSTGTNVNDLYFWAAEKPSAS